GMDGPVPGRVLRRAQDRHHAHGLLLSGPREGRRPAAAQRMRRPVARAPVGGAAENRTDAAGGQLRAESLPGRALRLAGGAGEGLAALCTFGPAFGASLAAQPALAA